MMPALLDACAITTALVAGVFYAFSTFVMRALGRLEPAQGIAAMQSINIVVINLAFFAAFFGGGLLSIAALLVAWLGPADPVRLPITLGAACYLVGCLAVTMAGNVPLNDRLARADPLQAEATQLWRLYLVRWTRWNHLRTAASLAAAACFLFAANQL